MAPRRCDRNTSALPQCGQCRLGSTFIPNAPYYTNLDTCVTKISDSDLLPTMLLAKYLDSAKISDASEISVAAHASLPQDS